MRGDTRIEYGSVASVPTTLSGTPPDVATSNSLPPASFSIEVRNEPAAAPPARSMARTTPTPKAIAKIVSKVLTGSRKGGRTINREKCRRSGISAPGDLFDFSVTQPHERVRKRCGLETVGRHNGRGVLLPREPPEQFKNHIARRGIKIARGFVGQQDTR